MMFRCQKESECDIHDVFECACVKSGWAASGLQSQLAVLPNDTVLDVMARAFIICTKEQSVFIGMFCWSLWNRRNK